MLSSSPGTTTDQSAVANNVAGSFSSTSVTNPNISTSTNNGQVVIIKSQHFFGNSRCDIVEDNLVSDNTDSVLMLGVGDMQNPLFHSIKYGIRQNTRYDLVDNDISIICRNILLTIALVKISKLTEKLQKKEYFKLWCIWYDAFLDKDAYEMLKELLKNIIEMTDDDMAILVPFTIQRIEIQNKFIEMNQLLTVSFDDAKNSRLQYFKMICTQLKIPDYSDFLGRMVRDAALATLPEETKMTCYAEGASYAKYGFNPNFPLSNDDKVHINSTMFNKNTFSNSPPIIYRGEHHLAPPLSYFPFTEKEKELFSSLYLSSFTPLSETCYRTFRDRCIAFCKVMVAANRHPFRFYYCDAKEYCENSNVFAVPNEGYNIILTSNLGDAKYIGLYPLLRMCSPLLATSKSVIHTNFLEYDTKLYPTWQSIFTLDTNKENELVQCNSLGFLPWGISRIKPTKSIIDFRVEILWIKSNQNCCNTSSNCPGWGLYSCSKCKNVRYCSANCQRQHWKTHKADCVTNSVNATNANV